METKQIEVKSYKTVYVAIDGTEFDDKDQCKRYDDSAMGVVQGRVKQLVRKETDEWTALGGDSDHKCWLVVPKTVEDITAIRQLLVLYGNKGDSNELESQIGKVVYLCWNYDEDYMWFKTLESIVNYASDNS